MKAGQWGGNVEEGGEEACFWGGVEPRRMHFIGKDLYRSHLYPSLLLPGGFIF